MTPVGPRWSKHLPTIGQRKGPALGEVQGPALFASNQPPGRGYWSVSDNGGHALLFQSGVWDAGAAADSYWPVRKRTMTGASRAATSVGDGAHNARSSR